MLNANLAHQYPKAPFRKGSIRFLFLLLIVCVAFGN